MFPISDDDRHRPMNHHCCVSRLHHRSRHCCASRHHCRNRRCCVSHHKSCHCYANCHCRNYRCVSCHHRSCCARCCRYCRSVRHRMRKSLSALHLTTDVIRQKFHGFQRHSNCGYRCCHRHGFQRCRRHEFQRCRRGYQCYRHCAKLHLRNDQLLMFLHVCHGSCHCCGERCHCGHWLPRCVRDRCG